MASYNGYDSRERSAKYAVLKKGLADGSIETYSGPCMLCGDPKAEVEPHSEDYSKPYRWTPPAMYWLCRYCHRTQLHGRFRYPDRWQAYKDHVRRGGYASDLTSNPEIKREFDRYRKAIGTAAAQPLRHLRKRDLRGQKWWDRLR